MNDRMAVLCLCVMSCIGIGCDPGDEELLLDTDFELDAPGLGEDRDADALAGMHSAASLTPANRSHAFEGRFDAAPERYNGQSTVVDSLGRITSVSSYHPPSEPETDALVVRMSPTGKFLWARRYGSLGVSERASGVTSAANGAMIVAGSGDGRPLRFKIDSTGLLLWAFEEPGLGLGEGTIVTTQGPHYLMAGKVTSGGSIVPFATKFADDGTLLWARRYEDLTGLPSESEVSHVLDGGSEIYLVGTRRDLTPAGFSAPTQSMFIMVVDAASGVVIEMRLYPHADPTTEQGIHAPTLVKVGDHFVVGYSVHVEGDGHRAAIALLDEDLDPIGEIHYVSSDTAPGAREDLGLALFNAPSVGLDFSVAYGNRPGLLALDEWGGVLSSRTHGLRAHTIDHVEAAGRGPGGYVLVDHDLDTLELAIVDYGGAGLCEESCDVTILESEIGLELIPYPTFGQMFTSLTYPLPIVDEHAQSRSSCGLD